MKEIRILAVNPGSTSTKIAVFQDSEPIFLKNIPHSSEELSPFPELLGEYNLSVPGTTNLPGWLIEAKIKPSESSAIIKENQDTFTAYMDWDKTGKEIKVRTVRRGDIFQPLGLGCEKKVARFMLDGRIPRTWRHRIPILCDAQQILWIAGYRLDERVKITSDTSQVLCVKMSKI